jgi:hypothetical protein
VSGQEGYRGNATMTMWRELNFPRVIFLVGTV